MCPLSYFTWSFLCGLWLLHSAFPLNCKDFEYPWPSANPQKCCKKCPPGHYMFQDPDTSCDNRCLPCDNNYFMENFTVKMHCDICDFCSYPNMEYKRKCSATRDAVCGCKAGYRCKDELCKACERIPTTTPTTPPPTTDSDDAPTPKSITQDTIWFLVITSLLCAGLALVAVTKIKPFLRWIRPSDDVLSEKASMEPLSPEDGVSKPVQEVSCKCEQSTGTFVNV